MKYSSLAAVAALLSSALPWAARAQQSASGGEGPAIKGAPKPWQIGLQDPATPLMAELISFHNMMMIIITGIVLVVLGLLVYVMWRFRAARNPEPSRVSHNTRLEVIWTVVPVIILAVIVYPSLRLLDYHDQSADALMTVEVTGNSWYWGYEYKDFSRPEEASRLTLTSVMMPEDEAVARAAPRLLAVGEGQRLVLPTQTKIRFLITSSPGDVLHSWAVPAFGIKTDAIPGQYNETWAEITEPGLYYGQCSELCGEGHAFMPVAIEAVPRPAFNEWVRTRQIEDMGLEPEQARDLADLEARRSEREAAGTRTAARTATN